VEPRGARHGAGWIGFARKRGRRSSAAVACKSWTRYGENKRPTTINQPTTTFKPLLLTPTTSPHPTTQFTKDQDFSSSLEGPSEAEIQANVAAEREEALVEKIWEAPSEELKKERRDVREGGDSDGDDDDHRHHRGHCRRRRQNRVTDPSYEPPLPNDEPCTHHHPTPPNRHDPAATQQWYEPITERLVHASLMGEMQDVMGDSAQALQTPEQLLAFKEKQKRRGSISELRAKTRWKVS